MPSFVALCARLTHSFFEQEAIHFLMTRVLTIEASERIANTHNVGSHSTDLVDAQQLVNFVATLMSDDSQLDCARLDVGHPRVATLFPFDRLDVFWTDMFFFRQIVAYSGALDVMRKPHDTENVSFGRSGVWVNNVGRAVLDWNFCAK